MLIEYDPNKDERNIKERRLSFSKAESFDWATAKVIQDVRKNYTEQRFIATGYLTNRLHVICFTPIDGGIRMISFRKANAREVKRYET